MASMARKGLNMSISSTGAGSELGRGDERNEREAGILTLGCRRSTEAFFSGMTIRLRLKSGPVTSRFAEKQSVVAESGALRGWEECPADGRPTLTGTTATLSWPFHTGTQNASMVL